MAPARTSPIDPHLPNGAGPLDDDPWPRPATPGLALSDRLADLRGRTTPARMIAGAVALGLAVLVAWWLLRPPAAPVESSVPMASASSPMPSAGAGGAGAGATTVVDSAAPITTAATEVVVQAAGAVVRPGVYRLDAGARVDDLVRQAGGLAGDADADRVNLAAPLGDGQRVWVPRKGEEAPPDVVAGGGAAPDGAGTSPAGGTEPTPRVVDLNTATAEDLDTLPGVGPATAAAILAYRTEQGRFGAVDDLLEVRGIGEAKLEQLRPLVSV